MLSSASLSIFDITPNFHNGVGAASSMSWVGEGHRGPCTDGRYLHFTHFNIRCSACLGDEHRRCIGTIDSTAGLEWSATVVVGTFENSNPYQCIRCIGKKSLVQHSCYDEICYASSKCQVCSHIEHPICIAESTTNPSLLRRTPLYDSLTTTRVRVKKRKLLIRVAQ